MVETEYGTNTNGLRREAEVHREKRNKHFDPSGVIPARAYKVRGCIFLFPSYFLEPSKFP